MSKELGQALRILRKRCALTQQQIADVLHLDRSTYAYYERGTTEPDLKSIRKLARMFGIEPSALLPDADGKPYVWIEDNAGEGNKPVQEDTDMLNPAEPTIYQLPKDEQSLLILYRALSDETKETVFEYLKELNE